MREEWERECGRKLKGGGAVRSGGGSRTDAPEDPCDHHKLSSQHPHQHFLATALTVCVNRHTALCAMPGNRHF